MKVKNINLVLIDKEIYVSAYERGQSNPKKHNDIGFYFENSKKEFEVHVKNHFSKEGWDLCVAKTVEEAKSALVRLYENYVQEYENHLWRMFTSHKYNEIKVQLQDGF